MLGALLDVGNELGDKLGCVLVVGDEVFSEGALLIVGIEVVDGMVVGTGTGIGVGAGNSSSLPMNSGRVHQSVLLSSSPIQPPTASWLGSPLSF